ncbi:MAG: protein methyltransferase, partial [Desulfurococcales archaeon]|nr:protein methyltransferase [Desulfurococcales archaeon]
FLDMPDPWAALDNLYSSLKPSAPLLVFVPTYNQVDKLLSRIDNWRWAVTYAGEILERRLEPVPGAVRPEVRMIGFTGFILLLRRLAAKSQ